MWLPSDLGEFHVCTITDSSSVTHCKVHINSTTRAKCPIPGSPMPSIECFVPIISYGFSFVLWGTTYLQKKSDLLWISFLSHCIWHISWLSSSAPLSCSCIAAILAPSSIQCINWRFWSTAITIGQGQVSVVRTKHSWNDFHHLSHELWNLQ